MMMKALITGASSGIGRELARLLAADCEELVLCGRDRERLETLRKELAGRPGLRVTAVSADLNRVGNCLRLHRDHPDVDLLVNNAGFGDFGPFCDTDLEKELRMIDTNIRAMHILMKLYLRDMMDRDEGQILNVASIAGFFPGPLMATYYATKAYVVRLSEAVRRELRAKGSGVRISILCPGPVATNFERTANIAFQFNGTDARRVARYALDHLDRFYIVPGAPFQLARHLGRLIPAGAAASAVYLLQSRRRSGGA